MFDIRHQRKSTIDCIHRIHISFLDTHELFICRKPQMKTFAFLISQTVLKKLYCTYCNHSSTFLTKLLRERKWNILQVSFEKTKQTRPWNMRINVQRFWFIWHSYVNFFEMQKLWKEDEFIKIIKQRHIHVIISMTSLLSFARRFHINGVCFLPCILISFAKNAQYLA